jgi:hypothetical protein
MTTEHVEEMNKLHAEIEKLRNHTRELHELNDRLLDIISKMEEPKNGAGK